MVVCGSTAFCLILVDSVFSTLMNMSALSRLASEMAWEALLAAAAVLAVRAMSSAYAR